jgi:hypothetical protein
VSRGDDHNAELLVNRALELGTPLTQLNAALEDLEPAGGCLTRREALQRSAALIAGGTLVGPGLLQGRSAHGSRPATGTAHAGPAGLFMRLPADGGDGSYSLAVVTGSGLALTKGRYTGDTVVRGAEAYNVAQSWRGGMAHTAVTLLAPGAGTKRFTLPPAGESHVAGRTTPAMTETITSVVVRGTILYCAHTWLRIFKDVGRLPEAKGGREGVRLTSQPTIEVVDLGSKRLLGRWTGPEVPGACRAALKVSADGSGVFLSADMPSAPAVPGLYTFRVHAGQLTLAAERPQARDLLNALASQLYYWPAGTAQITLVARGSIHRYLPALGHDSPTALPVQFGNNRLTPGFQATFPASGGPVISSGDGRIFSASGGTPHLAATLPGKALRPPFLVYQGARLGRIFAFAMGGQWAADNREGIGGLWRLDGELRPVSHELAGTYISECQADSQGQYIAAVSSLDRALYLRDASGRTVAFSIPAHAELVKSSERI